MTSIVTTTDDVPIGLGAGGTVARVLDAELVPCAEGVVGEIYLSGGALARGYLGMPALTAERFVADPHGPAGGRMYRTGDVGEWRDGLLYHRGRVDDQLKIRGFRVEPGELERRLESIDGIVEAHVFPSGEPAVLVAAVATTSSAPSPAELRDILDSSVPSYLVPARIRRFDKLPRTAVGKIDRRLLRDLDAEQAPASAASGGDDLPPLAARIRELMEDVLERPITGETGFFAAGGHSLTALRLITVLETELGRRVDLRTLFAASTPRELADTIGEATHEAPRASPARPMPGNGAIAAGTVFRPGPAQERMLLLHDLMGGTTYTIAMRWSIDAPGLDAATATEALRILVERHSVLRTCYPGADEARVLPPDAVEPFDLRADAPLRLVVAARANGADIGVVVHHVATDEHGLEILQREFVQLIEQLLHNAEPVLPTLPITPAELADAQRAYARERLDTDLEHWRSTLAGHTGSGELPSDAHETNAGAGTVIAAVPSETPDSLAETAGRLRITPFMLFHAAVAVALQRAGAGDDLVLASPVAGRDVPGSASLIDCATNTIVIRHRGIGNGTIADLADRTRESALGALGHAATPLDVVQRESGGDSLSDVLVSAYDTRRGTASSGSVRCKATPLPAERAKAALAPTLVTGEDGVRVIVEHDRGSFSDARAEAIARAIAQLVHELCHRDPGDLVDALSLVSERERSDLLGRLGGEHHDIPLRPFGEHFRLAVERYADEPALTADGMTLSYADLDARVRRCVSALRARGAGLESVVAVSTERGIDMVVSHVAVLAMGSTFFAVDPGTPADRVATYMDLLPPDVVLTSGVELALPDGYDTRRLRMEELGADASDDAGGPDVPLDALAYVVFTSGTTGTPKPVGVGHRGVSKLIATQRARLGHARGRRILSFATPTFDAAFWQLCGTLCDGGELVVMPDDLRLPGPGFIGFVEDERIDVVSVPPSFLAALPSDARLPERVQLIVGAERLPSALVDRWAPRHTVVNAYGPSEATVNSTLHDCLPDQPGPVPIGRIDPGARGYVVDTAFSPCPVGFPGELVIGGEGVARGYLGDPARTASAFVADPFGGGTRCYRTGDRVAWRPDGTLDFLGRGDDQIKLRGFRIEPGEIAAALEAVPGVHQAAVVVRSESGRDRLIGYVVGATAEEERIRRTLRRSLPLHLVPDRIVVVDGIPRLPSGKLDRRALPEPPARAVADTGEVPPLSAELSRLFAQALELDEVRPDDDFFALGGSSLVAAGLLRSASELLGRPLSFADLLGSPTPSGLIEAGPRQDPLGLRLDLRATAGDDARQPLWLLPPLAGMSWCYSGLRTWIPADRPLIGLQSPNLSGAAPMPHDFAELATLWADEIERTDPAGVVHLAGWSFGGASALGVAAELQRRGRTTGLVAMLDSYPRAEWADAAPTRAESIRSALGMLGVDVPLDTAALLDDDEVAERMAEANPMLAGLEAFSPRSMIESFHAGPHLEASARFTGYRGDLVVFTAERTAARMATSWTAWREFVDGEVSSVPVDTTHQEMVSDAALSVIGPALDRLLADWP
jgi:nonribosomal peptide synthetase DhbF